MNKKELEKIYGNIVSYFICIKNAIEIGENNGRNCHFKL